MVEIIKRIEEKRERSKEILQKMLSEGKISMEEYIHLLEKNGQLSKNLIVLFTSGKVLVENEILKDLNELFKFEKKPQRTEQIFEVMEELILGSLGSKNPYVQRLAYSIARERSREMGLPETLPTSILYSQLRIPLSKEHVEEAYKILFNMFLSSKVVYISNLMERLKKLIFDDESLKSIILTYHAYEVAEAIYNWVRDNISYISEPGDWFKPALHTLIVGGGDCDCLAILLCSLWRSIGFRTYLGFLPRHVFPGVILPKPFIVRFSDLTVTEREILREGNESFHDLQNDDFVVISKEIRVPGEIQHEDPSIKIGSSEITLDNFTLAFMETDELKDLREELKDENNEAIKRIEEFLKLKEAKVFNIPSL